MNDVDIRGGGGVKYWPKLPTDSTEKLPSRWRGCQKSEKIGNVCLWIVPNRVFGILFSKTRIFVISPLSNKQ